MSVGSALVNPAFIRPEVEILFDRVQITLHDPISPQIEDEGRISYRDLEIQVVLVFDDAAYTHLRKRKPFGKKPQPLALEDDRVKHLVSKLHNRAIRAYRARFQVGKGDEKNVTAKDRDFDVSVFFAFVLEDLDALVNEFCLRVVIDAVRVVKPYRRSPRLAGHFFVT